MKSRKSIAAKRCKYCNKPLREFNKSQICTHCGYKEYRLKDKTKICKYCKEKFIDNSRNKSMIFCSREHRGKYFYANIKARHKCLDCNNIVLNKNTKRCMSCSRKNRHISFENKKRIRVCLDCKKEITLYESNLRCKSCSKLKDKNPMWKGDQVNKIALHDWIKRYKPKLKFCEECKIKPAYDLANISQEYKRDINDFEWLCRRCHMKKDGRMKNLFFNKIIIPLDKTLEKTK